MQLTTVKTHRGIEIRTLEGYDKPGIVLSVEDAKKLAHDLIELVYPDLRFEVENFVHSWSDDDPENHGTALSLDDIVLSSEIVKIAQEDDTGAEKVRRIEAVRAGL